MSHKKAQKAQIESKFEAVEIEQNICAFCAFLWQTLLRHQS
jgi:hypothetical protein